MNPVEEKEILALIYQEKTHKQGLSPIAITQETECFFFRAHNNTYDGWFIDVQYTDGSYELWFVVDVRGSLVDYDWYIQKVR